MTARYVGRYAPSPTGDLHMGNALAAVCAWARARRAGGRIVLRMEDLDVARTVPGAGEGILGDLATLGLHFDAGPDDDDGLGPYVQTQCLDRYTAALDRLRESGRLYACTCSRKELRAIASAPHGPAGPRYPGTCREKKLPMEDSGLPVAWRFVVEPGTEHIDDALCGRFSQDVAADVGDFVVKRKDSVVAYHLAVVVDDARQGITEVARGRDLLDSAPRQVQLFRALGEVVPKYAHLPLLVGPDGERLAKRNGSETLRARLAAGETPEALLGQLGAALGVCSAGERIDAAGLSERLDDEVLGQKAVTRPQPLETASKT